MQLNASGHRRRGAREAAVCALAMSLCAIAAEPAAAGKARDYLNAPKNTWVSFVNFGWSRSLSPARGGAEHAVSGGETDVTSQSLILARILDIGGRTGAVSVILPRAGIESAEGAMRASDHGLGDIGFGAEVNLFGAPALTREEMPVWTPEPFASIHFVATAPTGVYGADSALNVGTNRWSLSSTLNYSYTPDAGATWLEAYATVTAFTDNDDAPGAAGRLSQDPLFQVEAHASRNVTPDLWLSADAYYNAGGETERDGVGQDNATDTLRLGAGLGWRVGGLGQLLFNIDQVVAKPDGQPEGWAVRLTWARSW
jgi:hypothetical protein